MRSFSVLFITTIVLNSAAFGYTYSDYDWVPYNGHEYAITKEISNWTQAEAWAVEVGAHLATINDGDENTWLANFATSNKYHPYGVAWIGLQYKGEGAMTDSSSWQW